MTDADRVPHGRRMQVSKNQGTDLRQLACRCPMNRFFPTYDIQVDSVATECRSHLVYQKYVDKAEWEPGKDTTCVTQHFALRIDKLFRKRALNPSRSRTVLHQHEARKQTPPIEHHLPNAARDFRERHGRDGAVIDLRSRLLPQSHRE